MSHKHGEAVWYNIHPDKDVLHDHPWGDMSQVANAAAIISLLPKAPCKVLDAGCADGHLSHFMSLCGYEVTGGDVCEDVLNTTRNLQVKWNKKTSTAQFKVLDYDELAGNEWDAIVFSGSLHHSRDQVKTLRSAYNALKPGGVLVASEPGMFHGSSHFAKDWANKMDVTEESTPPWRTALRGWQIGFRRIKVYPNPVTLHKVAYQMDGLSTHPVIKSILSFPFGLQAVVSAKWLHGLIRMQKILP